MSSDKTVEFIEQETFEPISLESQQRYAFLIENCIQNEMINEISNDLLMRIKSRTNCAHLLNKYAQLADEYLSQVSQSYKWSIKKSILDYVLRNDREQARLNVKLNKVKEK